jgi:hypothetical protein
MTPADLQKSPEELIEEWSKLLHAERGLETAP